MADTISISLQKREVLGKQVRALRREGLVPAVIHDHGKPSIVVSGVYMDLARAYRLAGKHHPVQVEANGKKYTTLIKNVTLDPRKNTLTHVVFNAVSANQKVDADIPVHAVYSEGNEVSPAERAGLMVLHNAETVEVHALAKDLPDSLTYDGEKLVNVGDVVTVADLVLPKGVEIKTEEHQQLASVFEPSAIAAANDAAGGEAEASDEESVAADKDGSADADQNAADKAE